MANVTYKSLSYDPITSKFTDTACMVVDIDIPNITEGKVNEVFITKEKAHLNYYMNDKEEIVTFKIVYIPMNNDAGKKLLTEVKSIVDSVLTQNFKPSVATINSFLNDDIVDTVIINDCIVKSGSIELDKDDFIHIIFEISGNLTSTH